MYMILVAALCLFTALSNAFSFEANAATQCDGFAVSWSGGTPPFFLHLLPTFGTPRNISIPSTAFTNGKGTFQISQFPLRQGQEYLLAMSDASGFATGGTTNLLTVGASKGGATCNVEGPNVDFVYQLNSALTQCRPYVFSGYNNAVQPVTIMGLIPSGTSFVLRPPLGSPEFSWTANVERGTSIVFMVIDAQGRQGGVSDVKLVGSSDDRSCLNGRSPSSTSALPTSTGITTTGTTKPTTTSSGTAPAATTSGAASSGGASIAAIAGTVIGALVFLAVVVTLGLFFLRKRKDQQRPLSYRGNVRPMDSDLQYEAFGGSNKHHPYGLSTGAPNTLPTSPSSYQPYQDHITQPYRHDYQPSTYAQSTYTGNPNAHNTSLSGNAYDGYNDGSMLPYDSNPFLDSHQQTYPPGAGYPYQSSYALPSASAFALPNTAEMFNTPPQLHDRGQPSLPPPPPPPIEDPFGESSSTSDSITSARQRKAAMAGVYAYKPSTIMQHTDADDVLPPPNENGVVELPPQYTERRVLGLAVVNQSPPSPSPGTQQFPPVPQYPPPPS